MRKLLVCVIFLSGCVTQPQQRITWSNDSIPDNDPNRGQSQFTIDHSECAAYAAQVVPPPQAQPSNNSDSSNHYVNPFGSYAEGYNEGAAEGNRQNLEDACMMKRGWRPHLQNG